MKRLLENVDNYIEAVAKIRKSIEELQQQLNQLEVNTIDLLNYTNGELDKTIKESGYLGRRN